MRQADVDWLGWKFELGPTDPIGDYVITAVQGDSRRAMGAFTAVVPVLPAITTLDPAMGPAGTTFRFAVSTSSPNELVTIDLYRSVPVGHFDSAFDFAATMGSVTTDGDGKASYEFSTGTDAPIGRYCLQIRSSGECAMLVIS